MLTSFSLSATFYTPISREEESEVKSVVGDEERKANEMCCSVEFPQDAVQTLESNEHVEAVEADGEVKTQKKD